MVVVGGVLLLTTARRVRVWTDETQVWAAATVTSPWKPRPWINLGRQYALRGDHTKAQQAYHTALMLSARPERSADEQHQGHLIASVNLALAECASGACDQARRRIADLRRLYDASPVVLEAQAWLTAQP